MKKGDNVIIVNLLGKGNTFKLKDKVEIKGVQDNGYRISKGKKEFVVTDFEIIPDKCCLSEEDFAIVIDCLWYSPPGNKKQLELACRLEKVYHSGIKTIELDTTPIRSLAKEVERDLKSKKHLTGEEKDLAKRLGIKL